jgi:hypothetical protein
VMSDPDHPSVPLHTLTRFLKFVWQSPSSSPYIVPTLPYSIYKLTYEKILKNMSFEYNHSYVGQKL